MRYLVFAAVAMLAACSPSAPPAPATPTRNVDYRVTTMASTADRRFLVEFISLTDRDLCISANDWPTAGGELGANRPADAGPCASDDGNLVRELATQAPAPGRAAA